MAKTGRDRVNKDVASHQAAASKRQLKVDYRLFIAAAACCEDAVEKERYHVLSETVLKKLAGLKVAKRR